MKAAGTAVDGRSLRAERTRQALATAYLDLLNEGDVKPTAERIAERAGVSPRSVFKHFPDREDLFAAASEIQELRVREQIGEPPRPDAPLDERIDQFVAQRTRLLEFISPVRRSALLTEPFSEVIAAKLKMARDGAAAQVDAVFANELLAAGKGRGRDDLRAALVAISGWPTWESLRRHQGLEADQARRVMRAMLAAQLKHD